MSFWQIAMDEASKPYTAFMMGNLGFFECKCMPFGLCNAPATFQRLMQNCLGKMNLTYYLIYLDDVIVFSRTEEEHLKHLCIVFYCFWEHNLKLNPTKWEFFQDECNIWAIMSLRRACSPAENLNVVTEFTPPQTYTEIWAFLGLVGHYRWFIKGLHMLCNL